MKYRISRALIPSRPKRMQHLDGKIDILGQILLQHRVHLGKLRLPSETGTHIFPFTRICRGKVIDTEVTLAIIKLDNLTPRDRDTELVRILSPFGIQIEFVD